MQLAGAFSERRAQWWCSSTAFSRYRVEAFDLAATDYVLKPYSDERFIEALGRAKRRVRERRLGELAHQMAGVAAFLQHAEPGESNGSPARRSISSACRSNRVTGRSCFARGRSSGSRRRITA